ncbi:MAG: RHS repeat-associated core domain-containing protein, partial [Kiritimatiellae bacterium]|nr:RHS repeat-associated core domain-containing protein [Kiritimatiellia bacterium]
MSENRKLMKKSETGSADYTDRVFAWDGWSVVREWRGSPGVPATAVDYYWGGADLSGSMQGAGGVGGLLAVKRDGTWYVPLYDANGHQKSAKPKGNPLGDRDFIAVPKGRSEERYPATQRQLYVTAYVSESGAVVAEYEYDAFGATISQSGMMADSFRHRFSTKPWIAALGAYDYGERMYSPELRRWLSRDPIEENGGLNLYAMCGNDAVNGVDLYGLLVMVLDIKREREGDGFVDTS